MIHTLIIEDEKHAIVYLKSLLEQYCPNVYLVGTASTVEEAIQVIHDTQPELVLMDVELYGKLSFQILEQIPKPINFEMIFITGHQNYAMKAIKFSCLDYLLKPVDGKELVVAIQKFEKKSKVLMNPKQIDLLLQNSSVSSDLMNKIAVAVHDGFEVVNVPDIILCQADSNYTWIYTIQGEKILSSKNLQYFDDLLTNDIFFRCHKSNIINLNQVKKFSKSDGFKVYLKGDHVVDISIRKKDEFLSLILNTQNPLI